MKLFRQIQELVEDGEALICVLIGAWTRIQYLS